MTLLDDFINALRGSGATINIQGGTGNTMYTGTVNNTQHNYGEKSTKQKMLICTRCGSMKTSREFERHFGGGHSGVCWDCKKAISDQKKQIERKNVPLRLSPAQQWKVEKKATRQSTVKRLPRGGDEDMPI